MNIAFQIVSERLDPHFKDAPVLEDSGLFSFHISVSACPSELFLCNK